MPVHPKKLEQLKSTQYKLVQLKSNKKKYRGPSLPHLSVSKGELILAGIVQSNPVSKKIGASHPKPTPTSKISLSIPAEIDFSLQTIERGIFLNFRTQRGILHYHLPKDFPTELSSSYGTPILQISCLEKSQVYLFYQHVHALHQAMVGVARGYKKKIKIVGVGYKAFLENEHKLRITLGYSHQNYCNLDTTIRPKFGRKNNRLHLLGPSLPLVTGIAASLHHLKKPDVYKGKGMRYRGVKLIKKEGKKKK